jgi:dolichyl-phosphate-mannose-protein mannosyltransferase
MTTFRRGSIPARWLWGHRLDPNAPRWLLAVVSVLSLGGRLWYLPNPVDASTHTSQLIFDESYYVNAARVILGIHPAGGATYATAVLGHDPNAEHPPLAKLLIALSMKVFGDNAWGWRIFPVIFGSAAILAMYWVIRKAGGGRWLALGGATLMAVDNLLLVHGRIATLDIFVVTFMLVALALYLRGNHLVAGLVVGIGLCTKLVAVDVLFIIVLLEAARVVFGAPGLGRRAVARARAIPVLSAVGVAVVTYLALLFGLDLIAAPIGGSGSCAIVPSGFHNPIQHTSFMLCYAGKLTNPAGPTGIASYPWQWLLNMQPIDYYKVVTTVTANGKTLSSNPIVWFRGEMNPAIIILAVPALFVAGQQAWRHRDSHSLVAVAWFAGTFLPFVVAAAPIGSYGNRTSYIYYMVIVMPAAYMAVAQLFSRRWLPRAALLGFVVILGYWFVTLYPFQTWSGS